MRCERDSDQAAESARYARYEGAAGLRGGDDDAETDACEEHAYWRRRYDDWLAEQPEDVRDRLEYERGEILTSDQVEWLQAVGEETGGFRTALPE